MGDPDVPSCLQNLFCSRTKQGSETSLSSWFSIPNTAVNEAGGLWQQEAGVSVHMTRVMSGLACALTPICSYSFTVSACLLLCQQH